MATTTRRKAVKKKVSKGKKRQQRKIRTSERSSFKACRWQWLQVYLHRLSPIQEAPALKFGTLVHEALEVRYPPGIKRGPKPAETFEKLFMKQLKHEEEVLKIKADGEWEDMLDLGIQMLEGYVEKYGKDEDWKVIASEMTFKVPVFLPAEFQSPLLFGLDLTSKQIDGKQPIFYYVGTMDGVWENRMDGGVRINDYKTTSSDPTKEAMGKSILDEQASAYWTWGADYLITEGLLKPSLISRLDGMLYTFLYKARRDERETNHLGQALNKDGT